MTGTTLSCVKGTSTLVRPKFGPGMLLQADDLDALTTYTRDLNRLLFRSLFGCGVVCGLDVTTDIDKCGDLQVTVNGGVALGCDGAPIYVPKGQTVTVGDCESDDYPLPPKLWVLLCATSKCCAPRTASCGCDDDSPSSTPTRVRDTYEIRVVSKLPKCVCCYQDDQDDQDAQDKKDAAVVLDEELLPTTDTCPCGPTDGCYADHYAGKCACCDDCADDGSCDCNCVLLAKLTEDDGWTVDHCVRRFIRPIFMRDPLCEQTAAAANEIDLRAGKIVGKRPGPEVLAAKRPKKAKAKVP